MAPFFSAGNDVQHGRRVNGLVGSVRSGRTLEIWSVGFLASGQRPIVDQDVSDELVVVSGSF